MPVTLVSPIAPARPPRVPTPVLPDVTSRPADRVTRVPVHPRAAVRAGALGPVLAFAAGAVVACSAVLPRSAAQRPR